MNLWRRLKTLCTPSPPPPPLKGIKFDKASSALKCKIVFLGDSQTGKSHLIWACTKKYPWLGPYDVPVYEALHVNVNTAHGPTEIMAYDMFECPEYPPLRYLVYGGTGILAFVFSIDDHESLKNMEGQWKEEVEWFCPGIPRIVIGCKADLRAKQSQAEGALVETQEGIELARRLGAWRYIECSAQKYANIEELSACLANIAWEIYEQHRANPSAPLDHGFETVLMSSDKGLPAVL
ncbi:P-loop containing nucleoside triphosphate hydrolase protein [Ceratobasidium sp. AG-I]|nr:P-loop containing nucleoside triphosphate hydrolase protein [Ceratobasidium sp. AG-I]